MSGITEMHVTQGRKSDMGNAAVAATTLAGAGVGAYLGVKNAPNLLGKVNVNQVLERTPYTDYFYDSCKKIGPATSDAVKVARSYLFDAEHCFKDHVSYVYNKLANGAEKLTVSDILNKMKVDPTVLTIDEVSEKEAYIKALEKLDGNTSLTKEELTKIFRNNSNRYNIAKEDIQRIIDSLPKQKGKYALIGTVIGATVLGTLAYIIKNCVPAKNK